MVRFLVRQGLSGEVVLGMVNGLANRPGYQFWPDSVSYADADLSAVIGHRQVTDAYLISLVRAHPKAKLATLDQPLAATYARDAILIP